MKLNLLQRPKADTEISPLQWNRTHEHFIGALCVVNQELISVSEDGKMIATKINQLHVNQVILDIGTGVNHLVFSKKHQLIIAAADDFHIYFIDAKTYSLFAKILAHESYVTKLAVHEDQLFSISKDKTIKIWDIPSQSLIQTLLGHQEWVYSLAVSPNGKQLVTTANNCEVKIWDLETYENTHTLVEGSVLVYSGNMLIIGGTNETGIGNKDFPNSSIWFNKNQFFTLGSDVVCWNAKDFSVKWHKDFSYSPFKSVIYVENFEILIAVSDQIYGIDPRDGEVLFTQGLKRKAEFYSCCVSGDFLFTGDEDGVLASWDLIQLLKTKNTKSFNGDVYRPVFIPEANRIIAGSWLGGGLSIWSPKGDFIAALKGLPAKNDQKIIGILPEEPNKIITTGCGELWIVDVSKGKIDRKWPLDNKNISVTAGIFLDSKHILLSCAITQPRLLNVETGELKIVRSDFCLNSENFKINDHQLLLHFSFFIEKNYYESTAEFADFSFEVKQNRNQIGKKTPLLIFDLEKKEVVREIWYEDEPKKEKDHYAWPMIGGKNNEMLAAAYLDEKRIHFYTTNETNVIHQKSLKSEAQSNYSSPYPVFATEKYFVFRMDNSFYRYEIQTKKWKSLAVQGWKSAWSPDQKYFICISNNTCLNIIDLEKFTIVTSHEMNYDLEWVLWQGDRIFVYNQKNGMTVFEVAQD